MKLEILHDRPALGGHYDVDIVAIHGLMGHYLDTWTYKRPKANRSWRIAPGRASSPQVDPDPCWIRDWLPEDIPGARVLSFDYNSDIFGSTYFGVADVANGLLTKLHELRHNCRKRPLIFIVHSLGGIVCKKALVGMKLNNKYQDMAQATQGVIFFGTPHRGSNLANLANNLTKSANFLMKKPNSKFLHELEPDNATGEELTGIFSRNFANISITSFFEAEAIGYGIRDILVKRSSAVLSLPNEEELGIEAKHQEMCKFLVRGHGVYATCCYRIKEVLDKQESLPTVAGTQQQLPNVTKSLTGSALAGTNFSTPEDGWALIRASREGKLGEVRSLLARSTDTSFIDEHGSTALCRAAQWGHAPVVTLLLDSGADVQHANDDGWTPLIEACFHGHPHIVELLLKHNADPLAINRDGWRPLHVASRHGHYLIAQLLLQNGADHRAINKEGKMPLNYAAQYGFLQIAKLLLDSGADPSSPSTEGWTPLHEAANWGFVNIVQLLLDRKSDPLIQNRWGETALHRAALSGHINVARTLLDRGSDPSISDVHGGTAGFRAFEKGHVEIAQLLGYPP